MIKKFGQWTKMDDNFVVNPSQGLYKKYLDDLSDCLQEVFDKWHIQSTEDPNSKKYYYINYPKGHILIGFFDGDEGYKLRNLILNDILSIIKICQRRVGCHIEIGGYYHHIEVTVYPHAI